MPPASRPLFCGTWSCRRAYRDWRAGQVVDSLAFSIGEANGNASVCRPGTDVHAAIAKRAGQTHSSNHWRRRLEPHNVLSCLVLVGLPRIQLVHSWRLPCPIRYTRVEGIEYKQLIRRNRRLAQKSKHQHDQQLVSTRRKISAGQTDTRRPPFSELVVNARQTHRAGQAQRPGNQASHATPRTNPRR